MADLKFKVTYENKYEHILDVKINEEKGHSLTDGFLWVTVPLFFNVFVVTPIKRVCPMNVRKYERISEALRLLRVE